jgi:peptidoglycan-associated lipoprotein
VIGKSHLKSSGSLIALATILGAAGCHKAAPPTPPPPPAAAAVPAPTATLTANPAVISAGSTVTLTWRTTDATDVTIEGIGSVPSSGTKSVQPTDSTTYHLVAKNDTGSADATARVTVNAPPPAAAENTGNAESEDAIFHQQVQDVFFDYDSYELRPDAQSTISKAASYFTAHPNAKVVIGGYCDERGSNEYNLALGEDRADAAKNALVSAGVNANRVRVISYGKEKQFCSDHNEQCWQQNRRAGFNLDK